jgi:hypothetical protein
MVGPFCADCIAGMGDDQSGPDFHPVFFTDEADTPTHCEKCEALMVHDLTPDGIAYVREALQAGTGRREVRDAWRNAYGWEVFTPEEVGQRRTA